ncbi:Protein translocase subunit SecF [Moorella thermoacetica]|uniref:Protein-export membrane protein SecF n=1 Tax=Neomoorella thermoacetica TaxID=1525 RepID=A0AAC9HI99_NEOTH|nr:protein translocase subunit SecF [Moorella thermoacetica]AOQ24415.1 preprotein translocase subunit SecF [Moorella thermoacetica]TYL11077.1 Protein translocase subunit SecF [Moorella thermoacetica]
MNFNFDFVNRRKWWYALSLLVIIPGLIAMALHLAQHRSILNFGIDFTGGNIIQVQFHQPVTSGQVRDVLDGLNLGKSSIQESGSNQFLIRTTELNEEQTNQVISTLQSKLGQLDLKRNEKVGGTIGRELTIRGVEAMVIAWILMIIYITIRFEFLSGLAAILALVHDVLVTIGFFALFRWEVDSTFIAAILTIIGYSINDTIVIFDRIRENLRLRKKETIEEVVNRSINQTLTRSINTVLTVIFALLALILLGGETTRTFALAMLIGTISGCYSSIFTASPLWIDFRHLSRERHRQAAAVQTSTKARTRKATSH